jgi:hypothetical protein
MDSQLASYVIGYYSHFMSEQEQLAYRHLLATMKASKGRSDATAQKEVADQTSSRKSDLH